MLMYKIRVAGMFLLVIGIVAGGAGLLTYNPQAAQPEPPPVQKADGGQRLKDLLRKRLDAARREFKARKEGFLGGQPTPPALAVLVSAALRVHESELAVSEGKAGRIATCQAHLKRIQEIEDDVRARAAVGRAWTWEVDEIEFHRLDAEIRLEQAKAG